MSIEVDWDDKLQTTMLLQKTRLERTANITKRSGFK